MSPEIRALKDEYEILWKKLGYEKPLYPLNTEPKNDYMPHIEYADEKYKWFVTEYGACCDYRETTDARRALEWFAVEVVCPWRRRAMAGVVRRLFGSAIVRAPSPGS